MSLVLASSLSRGPTRLTTNNRLGSTSRISKNRQLYLHLQHFNYLNRGRICGRHPPLKICAKDGEEGSYGSKNYEPKEDDDEEEEEEVQLEEGDELGEVDVEYSPFPASHKFPEEEEPPDDEPAEFDTLDVSRMRVREEVAARQQELDQLKEALDRDDRYKEYEQDVKESGVEPAVDEEGNIFTEDVNSENEYLAEQNWTYDEIKEAERLKMRGELVDDEEEEIEELPEEFQDMPDGPYADIPDDEEVDASEQASEITPDMVTGEFEGLYGGEFADDDTDPRFVPELPPLNYQMDEDDMLEINRQIGYAESLQQLREFIIASNINIHPSHIWMMILKVPLLIRDVVNDEEREDAFAFLDDMCIMLTPLCYDIMSTELIVGVMWTLATLAYASNSHLGKAVFQELMYEACRKIKAFDEDDVYFTLDAMGKANFNVMAPMVEISETVIQFMDEYNSEQIAGLIRNYALLQRYNPFVFDRLTEKAHRFIYEYDAIDRIHLLWALVFVHHYDEGLFQHAWEAVMDLEDIRLIGASEAAALLESGANADYFCPEVNEKLISLFDYEGVLQHAGTDTLGTVIISWAMMREDARRIPHIIYEVYTRFINNEAFISAIPEQLYAAYRLFKEDEYLRVLGEADEITNAAIQAELEQQQIEEMLQKEKEKQEKEKDAEIVAENEEEKKEEQEDKIEEEQKEEKKSKSKKGKKKPKILSEEQKGQEEEKVEEEEEQKQTKKKSKKSKKKEEEEEQIDQEEEEEGDEAYDDAWRAEGYDQEEEEDDEEEAGKFQPGEPIRVMRIRSIQEEEELEKYRLKLIEEAADEEEAFQIGKQIVEEMNEDYFEMPYEEVLVDHIFPPRLVLAGREAWDDNEKIAVKEEEESRRIDNVCEVLMQMGFEDVQPTAYSGEETMDGEQRGIVCVDIGFTLEGKPHAIQVQGKQAFFANLMHKQHGYTLMQGRLWEICGWAVYPLAWFEWDIIPGPELKAAYLLHLMGVEAKPMPMEDEQDEQPPQTEEDAEQLVAS